MERQCQRVKRGMIFWFDPAVYGDNAQNFKISGKNYKSSVQVNRRPWLVVSNDAGNSSAPTCNIVPITTECKTRIPTHVSFLYLRKTQTALCEQIRTVDINALEGYVGTVSDDVLLQVEKALQIQLGIRPEVVYSNEAIDNTVSYLERLVSMMIKNKYEEMKPVVSNELLEDSALRLGQMIEDLVVTKTETATVIEDTDNTTKNEVKLVKPVTNKRGKRTNKWNTESCKEFLNDYDNMTTEEIQKKYNLSKKASVYQTKYICKKNLGCI